MNFFVADHLAVDVLVGINFLNKHVLSIRCMAQQVRLRGSKIPILGTEMGPQVYQDSSDPEEDEGKEVRSNQEISEKEK